MQNDVKAFIGIEPDSCVQVNSGAYPVKVDNDAFYSKGAVVPKQDWKPLNQEEYRVLITDSCDVPRESLVGIIELPSTCFTPLEEAGFYKLSTKQEIAEFQKLPKIHALYEPIYAFLVRYLVDQEGIMLTPFLTKPPNQFTVTSNISHGVERGVGIHLDTWDKLGWEELPSARNRICINGGLQERHFLFYNLTVAKIVELLQNKGVNNPQELLSSHRLLHAFLEYYPNYPIVKLKVKPRQAYIAPTENIFHDATTFGTNQLDIHMTCRGHFKLH